MTRIVSEILIRAPIERVFDYVTTPANWPQWHPASLGVSEGADHPLEVGEQVSEEFEAAGRRGRALWTVREREPPRRWVIDGTSEGGGAATRRRQWRRSVRDLARRNLHLLPQGNQRAMA